MLYVVLEADRCAYKRILYESEGFLMIPRVLLYRVVDARVSKVAEG